MADEGRAPAPASVNCGVRPGTFGSWLLLPAADSDGAQLGVSVERVGEEAEALALIGPVMDRVRPRRGGAEGGVALAVEPADVVAEPAGAAAVLRARLERPALPAEDRDAAAGLLAAVLGLDVDDAAGGVAVARRQDAIEQVDLLDEQRIDHRQEGRVGVDVERHQHAVDLVLELRPFGVADVDLLVLVDGDAGHLRQHVGQRGVGAGRQIGDVLRRHRILVGAARRHARPARAAAPRP